MRLWRALENIHGWAGVRSVWREHMGDDLQFLEPLLTPMEELALSVPWPGAVEGRKVVVHDGTTSLQSTARPPRPRPFRAKTSCCGSSTPTRSFAGSGPRSD